MTTLRSPLLIHIGYPRTATSFLQREIFLNHRIGCGIPFSNLHQCNHIINELITYPRHFKSDEAKKILYPFIETIADNNLIPVISNEHLCSASGPRTQKASIIAERLLNLFPQARILITTRNQPDVIVSLYKSYLAGGGTKDIAHFMIAHNPRYFSTNHLFYDKLINLYIRKFSPERVLVLRYEDLITNPETYLDALLSFISLSPEVKKYINKKKYYRKSSGSVTSSIQKHCNPLIMHIPKILSRPCSRLIDALTPLSFEKRSDRKNVLIVNDILQDIYRDNAYSNINRKTDCAPITTANPTTPHT